MVKARSAKDKKCRFLENQHTSKPMDVNFSTTSSSKLSILDTTDVSIEKETFEDIKVLGLRLIGSGFNAGKKGLMTLNPPYVTKANFRSHELKLNEAVEFASE
ncbi:hypothetical protein AVEN_244759-1 [Araneus ventricosus]|uniref:Uncharacterized protein n=1 Tax=Araneus ventricosus TaxID=182803 RepID=A0A4Y2BSW4_ARAVE|nr:hypothetical protein AVEN_244759-1 [Araneus ventricosus]